MEVKKGQEVKLWNGESGSVLSTFQNSAKVRLASGVAKTVHCDHIVEATNPLADKFEKAKESLKYLFSQKTMRS
jgi:hypothetical protein